MSEGQNPYGVGLDKCPANFLPLTPLSFLSRTAAVYPDLTSTIYEDRSFTWAQTYDRCKRFASYLSRRGIELLSSSVSRAGVRERSRIVFSSVAH